MSTTKKQLHAWIVAPFENVSSHLEESGAFAEAVSFGISSIGRVALAEELFQELKATIRTDFAPEKEAVDRLGDLRRRAEEAKQHMESGLPLLHSQLSLGMWGILEASMDDLLVAWLCNVPSVLQIDDFAKIKVSIGEFEQWDRASQMQYVLAEYKRNGRSDAKLGVERFEMLLKPIGLSGPIEDNVRRDIYELSQVRNAILHRASRADLRLVSACPWLGLKVGDKIKLTGDDSSRYTRSITDYLKNILLRLYDNPDAVEAVEPA